MKKKRRRKRNNLNLPLEELIISSLKKRFVSILKENKKELSKERRELWISKMKYLSLLKALQY